MNTKFIDGLQAVANDYDAFILDQYGVLHDGAKPLEGVLAALVQLLQRGKKLVILSNASRRIDFAEARLVRIGFDKSMFCDVVCSGQEAYDAMLRGDVSGGRCVMFGWDDYNAAYLEGLNVEVGSVDDADFLLALGTENIMTAAGSTAITTKNTGSLGLCKEIMDAAAVRGLPMVVTNSDVTVLSPSGDTMYMPGLMAQYYESVGGTCLIYGKPELAVYTKCLQALGQHGVQDKARVIAVGDSVMHDIRGACNAGLDSILIASGIHSDKLLCHKSGISSDALRSLCREENAEPTYVLDRFKCSLQKWAVQCGTRILGLNSPNILQYMFDLSWVP